MNKKYVFVEGGYQDWNGLYYPNFYRCISHEDIHDQLWEEDCYISAIVDNYGLQAWEGAYDLSLEELKAMCYEAGIVVQIFNSPQDALTSEAQESGFYG